MFGTAVLANIVVDYALTPSDDELYDPGTVSEECNPPAGAVVDVDGAQAPLCPTGRSTMAACRGGADRVMFHECPIVMADGRTESTFIALPTEYIDVLSPRSEIAPNGVVNWRAATRPVTLVPPLEVLRRRE